MFWGTKHFQLPRQTTSIPLELVTKHTLPRRSFVTIIRLLHGCANQVSAYFADLSWIHHAGLDELLCQSDFEINVIVNDSLF